MPFDLGDGAQVTVAPPVLPQVTTAPPSSELVVVPVVGPRGPAGPAGDQSGTLLFTRQAASGSLGGHRVVRPNPDGSISYAGNDQAGDLGAPLWLTLQAGPEVQVCAFGSVDEPSWSWAVGPLYLGTGGQLTQTVPTPPALFLTVVGYATGPNSVFIEPSPPIRLI